MSDRWIRSSLLLEEEAGAMTEHGRRRVTAAIKARVAIEALREQKTLA